MSLPSLENLLSQAPPVDLSAPQNVFNTNASNNSLQARRSSIPLAGHLPLLPFHWPTSVDGRNAAGTDQPQPHTVIQRLAYETNANANANTTTAGTPPQPPRLEFRRWTPPSAASQHRAEHLTALAGHTPGLAQPSSATAGTAPMMRRTSPRLREVAAVAGQKRSTEATAATAASAPAVSSPPLKRRKASGTTSRNSRNSRRKAPPPPPVPTTDEACCICLTVPEPNEVATIDGCAHCFCYGCIRTWSETENSCPLCKTRFTSIIHASASAGTEDAGTTTAAVQIVPTRNQRSEAGLALDGLLSSLAAGLPVTRGANGTISFLPASEHPHLGRFLLRSLGTGMGYTTSNPTAALGIGGAGGGGLVDIGGLQFGGYSNGGVGMFGNATAFLPPDGLFDPSLLNVIMRSSTITTTTHTTSVGILPTAASAAASMQQQLHAVPAPMDYPFAAAAAAAAGVGGHSMDTAIEIDSDDAGAAAAAMGVFHQVNLG
jgi:Ring finger domain